MIWIAIAIVLIGILLLELKVDKPMQLLGKTICSFDPITDKCVMAYSEHQSQSVYDKKFNAFYLLEGQYYFMEPINPIGMTAEQLQYYAIKKEKNNV